MKKNPSPSKPPGTNGAGNIGLLPAAVGEDVREAAGCSAPSLPVCPPGPLQLLLLQENNEDVPLNVTPPQRDL